MSPEQAYEANAAALARRDADRYRGLRELVKSPRTMVLAQALFWNNSSRGEFDKALDRLLVEVRTAPDVAEAKPAK